MAFKLKIAKQHSQTGSTLYVYDDTKDYVQDDDYGWGQGDTPIERSDYVLLCFVKYTDHAGNESYLEHANQFPSASDKSHGLADGNGLANTDRSMFTITTPKDGHHGIYMLPLEKDSTRVNGNSGDVYYNTSDNAAYYHDGSQFVPITSLILPSLESLSVTKVCEYLFDIRIRIWEVKTGNSAYTPRKTRDSNKINLLRDIKNLKIQAFANFASSKPVSRFLINSITEAING